MRIEFGISEVIKILLWLLYPIVVGLHLKLSFDDFLKIVVRLRFVFGYFFSYDNDCQYLIIFIFFGLAQFSSGMLLFSFLSVLFLLINPMFSLSFHISHNFIEVLLFAMAAHLSSDFPTCNLISWTHHPSYLIKFVPNFFCRYWFLLSTQIFHIFIWRIESWLGIPSVNGRFQRLFFIKFW